MSVVPSVKTLGYFQENIADDALFWHDSAIAHAKRDRKRSRDQGSIVRPALRDAGLAVNVNQTIA